MHICLTGASRGLGFTLAETLLHAGHSVWGVARNVDALERLQKDFPQTLHVSSVDISSKESVEGWMRQMREQAFDPEVLILNASIQQDDMKQSYDHALGSQTIEVNLQGTLRCVDAFLPAFLKRHTGEVIAIASTAALRPSVRSAAYAASKAGVAMAMRTFDLRYHGEGILFKTVYLGPIATEMWEGKRSPLIPDATRAAASIAGYIGSPKRTLYFPLLSTTLLRLTLWLPDSVFAFVSGKTLR